LRRNTLRRQHLVLEGVHARGGFVDASDERDRSLEDWFETFAVLDAGFRILVGCDPLM
jgi:hypothetical protein